MIPVQQLLAHIITVFNLLLQSICRMDKIDLGLSDFAKTINFPLCQFLDEFNTWPQHPQKKAVSFLSGDPTIYGQTQFQMPPRGYEIIKENIAKESNHGYIMSNGTPAFREAVAKLYKSKVPIKASGIQINHGVNMGLLAAFLALTNEGDEVLVPEIGYPFYQNLCPSMKRKAVPYRLKKESNFQIDLEHVASLVNEKTAFMYVINPTNPMGTVFSRKHMEEILSLSDKLEVPLVCDEVYFRMVYPGEETLSFAEVTEDVPVIVLSGVQKIMSVPGWVQSWTVVVDKHQILSQIKDNLNVIATIFLHTNSFIQHSMPQLLEEVGIFTSKNMDKLHENYLKLVDRINRIAGLKPIPAQGTIYLSVQIDCSRLDNISSDIQFVRLLRLEQNVNLLPLSVMGQGICGVRLLTCGGEQLYGELFKRLQDFLDRHKKQ